MTQLFTCSLAASHRRLDSLFTLSSTVHSKENCDR